MPRYTIRLLLLVMVLTAHACAKPYFASRLNEGFTTGTVTWIPFVIQTTHISADGPTVHEDIYIGLLGQYWMCNRASWTFSDCGIGNLTPSDQETVDRALKQALLEITADQEDS